MKNIKQLTNEDLEEVVGGEPLCNASMGEYAGKIIAWYIQSTRCDMPSNKIINATCIYRDRLEAIQNGDQEKIKTTENALSIMGINVKVLDDYANGKVDYVFGGKTCGW